MADFAPILILLTVVGIVLSRLPKVAGLGHTDAFRKRRVLNWLPLGLTYAFLYMGRYNIKVSQHAFGSMPNADGNPLMTNADFGVIFGVGTLVYGSSFLLNGPLTDRYGGKKAILVGAGGAMLMNLLMGLVTLSIVQQGPFHSFFKAELTTVFSVLYAGNMYFQSFGAVAIVKTNAPWFHVRERGVFGAIFGILISLGVYFAYDWGFAIVKNFDLHWVFLTPAIILSGFWIVDFFVVKDSPSGAGHKDFDLGDAVDDGGEQLGAVAVFKMMFRNPVIMTIAAVEFCSGFLRQAIMQWFRTFAKQTDGTLHLTESFVYNNWGMLLCCAGIMGGVFAGIISDKVFESRRGPVAAVLYGAMLISSILLVFVFKMPIIGLLVVFMSMCIIGVHGMLSGTASMDFGGKRNVGVAVGIIDGFVYAGTALMAFTYAWILPEESLDASGNFSGPATDPSNWISWPISMIPVALIGLLLARKVWNATPRQAEAKKA